MSNEFDNSDVIIIGGGLAGLTTAALLARSGKTVTLFERSSKEIGGRARSTEVDGFYLNQGPHALFLTDSTDSILKEIGITFTGGVAAGKGKSYLISGPDVQRNFAKRMNATTISLNSSHASLVTHPDEIAELILNATKGAMK